MPKLDRETKKTLSYRFSAETLAYMADYRAPSHTKGANIERLSAHLVRVNSKLDKLNQRLEYLGRIRQDLEFVPTKKRTFEENLTLDKLIQEIKHVKKQIKQATYHGNQAYVKRSFFLGDMSHGRMYRSPKRKAED